MADEHFHRIHLAGERGGHQRGLPFFGGAVGIGSGLQQVLDDGCVAVGAGERKRCDPVGGLGLCVGARGDEEVGDFEIVALHRPM